MFVHLGCPCVSVSILVTFFPGDFPGDNGGGGCGEEDEDGRFDPWDDCVGHVPGEGVLCSLLDGGVAWRGAARRGVEWSGVE